jgi:hypothetical protein
MEGRIDPGPLQSTWGIREYEKIEKAGMCYHCSLNLKAEMEALFWKWQLKASEDSSNENEF